MLEDLLRVYVFKKIKFRHYDKVSPLQPEGHWFKLWKQSLSCRGKVARSNLSRPLNGGRVKGDFTRRMVIQRDQSRLLPIKTLYVTMELPQNGKT